MTKGGGAGQRRGGKDVSMKIDRGGGGGGGGEGGAGRRREGKRAGDVVHRGFWEPVWEKKSGAEFNA